MSLFAGLFAAPKQAGSPGGATLFSSSSKYAAQPLAAPAAAAAAAPEPGGGKKKKRKQEAAEAPAAPAAAAAEPSSKKSRKAQEQRRQQGQEERQQQADKAAAAAAAAAAAVPAEGEKKASKKRKQQQGEQQEQQGAAAPAAAAPATAAEGPSAKASGKPGKRDKALKPKPAAAAAEAAAEEGGSKAAGKAGGKAAEPAAAPKGKGGKAEAPSDERLPRTVFVGNLPATVKTKKIARLFAAAGCGAVESVRLRSLPLKQVGWLGWAGRGAVGWGTRGWCEAVSSHRLELLQLSATPTCVLHPFPINHRVPVAVSVQRPCCNLPCAPRRSRRASCRARTPLPLARLIAHTRHTRAWSGWGGSAISNDCNCSSHRCNGMVLHVWLRVTLEAAPPMQRQATRCLLALAAPTCLLTALTQTAACLHVDSFPAATWCLRRRRAWTRPWRST